MNHRPSLVRRLLSTTLLLVAVGAGCASDPADPDPVDTPDTTAPQVVDTYPAADQTGVSATDKIILTFSEPMDPGTVEAAWTSEQLPLDKVSLEWNEELTVLAISPDAPLAYAEGQGVDPTAVPALTYTVTLGTDAADLAGNPLAAPMQLAFSTKRRMTASFGLDLDFSRVTIGISSLADTEIMIGDNEVEEDYRAYLTFDLATLPAGATTIEAAHFSARQLAPQGSPYGLGAVNVHHVSYDDTTNGILNGATATSMPGTFSQDAVLDSKSIDVTPQVADDVAHRTERGDRSQYRLLFDQATDNDGVIDRANFAKNTFQLTATYIID